MMHAFGVTFLALIAMQLSPGPNLVAVASAGLSSGRKAALIVVAGIASGAFFWVVAVAAGLSAVLETYPSFFPAMKLVGGAYLVWLGLKGLYSAWRSTEVTIFPALGEEAVTEPGWVLFRRGLLVVLTNPKVALGWTAIGAFLFGSGLSALQVFAFAPMAATSALLVYGGYGLLFSTGSAVRLYQRFWRIVDAVFGTCFGLIGGALFIDGLRQISR